MSGNAPPEPQRITGVSPVGPADTGETPVIRERKAKLKTHTFSWWLLPINLFTLLCCVFPLLWMAWSLLVKQSAWGEFLVDSFRRHLLTHSLMYNGSAAIIATVMGFPVALVIGRGRGTLAKFLLVAAPVSLLLPSLVYAYGWSQTLRLMHIALEPAGFWDIARCSWTLATWLWPIAALIMGLSLRRMDLQMQQQAMLEGGLWRITLRQMLAPAITAAAIIFALAMQEFAVYEPTGISLLATEVRMVFDTGAFSSVNNPIAGAIAQGPGDASQAGRAAAALAAGSPSLAVTLVLAVIAMIAGRSLSISEEVEESTPPAVLRPTRVLRAIGLAVWLIAFVVPLIALVCSLKEPLNPVRIWRIFSPQILGSLFIAAVAAVLAMVLTVSSTMKQIRLPLIFGVATFLIGGQLLAIAQIRIYNRAGLDWMYEGFGVVALTYLSRFGWIALAAGLGTWSKSYLRLREMAAVDGADLGQTARQIILPLAWPILLAGSLLVMVLAMTEVPATVLLQPQKPQMMVPMLMTWVHMLRYDPMIEASLLMAGTVIGLSLIAFALIKLGLRRSVLVMVFSLALINISCGRKEQPDAMWCETGIGPGQVTYPRGIAYCAKDDTFFIVDRHAHIQHLNSKGEFLNDWLMPDFRIGKPTGLTVGPDGNLYVADTHYQRICVFSPDGKLIDKWGKEGRGPGEFIYPTDIAFDDAGKIYVSEYGDNDRISVFDKSHKFLYQIGHFGQGDGQFSRPQSMVLVGDTIYVTDACNHRINVFKTDGTFVRNMGGIGDGPGQFRFPYGMDMDKDGHLIVCEFGNNRVQMIDKDTGKGLKIWGHAGREPGELAYPWGVAVDKLGRIIAVDAGNNRLQVFRF